MTFTQPELNYAFDALEPHIDARTMEIHYTKHHAGYVANLNAAVEGTEWGDKTVEELICNLDTLPDDIKTAVRNIGITRCFGQSSVPMQVVLPVVN